MELPRARWGSAHKTKQATAMHLALLASLGRLGLSEHMWAEAADLTDLLRQGAGARGRSKRKEPKGVVHTQCKGRSTCKSGAYKCTGAEVEQRC